MYQIITFFRERWTHIGLQRYLQNASWMFGVRIFSLGVSFLATMYIARNLGPNSFGQLNYALSLVGLFSFVASLGIDGIVYRDLIKYPEKKTELLGTAFWVRLIAGSATMLIVALYALFFAEDDVSRILILILSASFIFNSFQVILYDFQSRADSKYPSIVALAITVVINILKVSIIALGGGVIYLALIVLIETILYALSYVYIYITNANGLITSWRFDRSYVPNLLKDSSPLIALSAFSVIYARIDQVFIKHLVDAASVGLYSAAVAVTEMWNFIPSILLGALFPAIVNAKTVSDTLYNKRLGKLTLLLFIFASIVAITITICATPLIRIIYGPAFLEASPILKIYIWSFIGNSFGLLITQYLITENSRKILSFVAFLPMVVNVVLNIILIPRLGTLGAAYATLISYSLIPFMLLPFKTTRQRIRAILSEFKIS
jgi:O-antigen/teichoic acid export membrane protein